MNMFPANLLSLALVLGGAPLLSWSISVSKIQGDSFLSPYEGQTLYDVYGILVAKVRPLMCMFRPEAWCRCAQQQTMP